MTSLYAKYRLEREGIETLEGRDGFISYTFLDNNQICYMTDIYVVPQKRSSRYARRLFNAARWIALRRGAKLLIGTVDPKAPRPDRSRWMLEYIGMKPVKNRVFEGLETYSLSLV